MSSHVKHDLVGLIWRVSDAAKDERLLFIVPPVIQLENRLPISVIVALGLALLASGHCVEIRVPDDCRIRVLGCREKISVSMNESLQIELSFNLQMLNGSLSGFEIWLGHLGDPREEVVFSPLGDYKQYYSYEINGSDELGKVVEVSLTSEVSEGETFYMSVIITCTGQIYRHLGSKGLHVYFGPRSLPTGAYGMHTIDRWDLEVKLPDYHSLRSTDSDIRGVPPYPPFVIETETTTRCRIRIANATGMEGLAHLTVEYGVSPWEYQKTIFFSALLVAFYVFAASTLYWHEADKVRRHKTLIASIGIIVFGLMAISSMVAVIQEWALITFLKIAFVPVIVGIVSSVSILVWLLAGWVKERGSTRRR